MEFKVHYSSSSGNLYQVESDAGNLIIDPGVPIAKIKVALEWGLSSISAALCSHSHGDHAKGLPPIARAGIDCYMTPETAQALKFNGHRLKPITPKTQFKVAGFNVLPFPLEHQDVRTGKRIPNVGFLISDGVDKLVYLTDTFYCHYKFKGLTHICIGVNYSRFTLDPNLNTVRKKRLFKSHMSLETALEFFKANDLSKVREIHLLHMSRDNANPEYFKSEIMKATGKPTYIGGQ